jgi:DNA-binding phage protein
MANRHGAQELTAEQREDIERFRAEARTPEFRAEMAKIREEVVKEFPPATMPAEGVEAMAELRIARERRGLDLGDVSRLTGIDRAALSKIERGQGNPTLVTIERIASAIGLKMSLTFKGAE